MLPARVFQMARRQARCTHGFGGRDALLAVPLRAGLRRYVTHAVLKRPVKHSRLGWGAHAGKGATA